MSWVTEDGLHEGHAAYITADGHQARGIRRDGMVLGYGNAVDGSEDVVVGWDKLAGWEARCDCKAPGSATTLRTWIGPMWRRRNPDHQDPSEMTLDEGDTVEDALLAAWEQHVQLAGAR